MKTLLLDNFDSFVYNIYQYLGEIGMEVDVFRNNAITVPQIEKRRYDRIVISPGPGNPTNPKDFGVCNEVIKRFGKTTPMLGICLGNQGIISAFGGRIVRAKTTMHGKTSYIRHDGTGLFAGVKNPVQVMRYHSLIGEEESFPECLEVTARSEDDNEIMAVRHRELPIFGVQFHPESILTEEGKKILGNFQNIE